MRRNRMFQEWRDEAVAGFGDGQQAPAPNTPSAQQEPVLPLRARASIPSSSYGGHLRQFRAPEAAPRQRRAPATTPMGLEPPVAFAESGGGGGGEVRRRRGTQRIVEGDEALEDEVAFFIPPEGKNRKGVLEGFIRSAAEDDDLLDEKDVAFVKQSEVDLQATNERLRERLKELRRIAVEFRDRKRTAEASSRLFQRKFEELQREREELEQRLKGSEAAANRLLTRSKEAEERRRQIERRQRRLGYEEGEVVDPEEDVVDENLPAWRRAIERVKILGRRAKRWWYLHAPLLEDVRYVEARYGSGLGVYFSFFRFVVYSSTALGLLWFALQVLHWVDLGRGNLPSNAGTFASFFPRWALYSSFSSSEAVLYGATTFLTATVIATASFVRQVHESRFKKASDLHEASSQNFKLARVGLSLVDVSSDTVGEFDNARQATAEHFRLVLNNAELEARIAARTREERTRLLARKVIGNALVVLLVLLGSGIIVVLTLFNTRITAALAGTSISSIASFVIPVTVNVVNATVPVLIVFITKYEQWDRPGTGVKMLLWRLYIVKVFNIVVQVLTYFDVRSDKYIVSDKSAIETDSNYLTADGTFCPEDYVGQKLFVNVLSDYFVNRLLFAAVVYKDLKFSKDHVAFFDLPNQMTDLLITASTFWVTVPYFPYLALVEAPLLYAAFKYEKLMLVRYMSKPAQPWSASDTGMFLVWLTDASAALAVVSFYYFLSQAGRTACGPYYGAAAYDLLYEWVAARSSFLEVLLAILTHPLFIWGTAVGLGLYARVLQDSIDVVQIDWEDKQYQLAKQVSLLSQTIRRLRGELDFYRKQEKGLAEEAAELAADDGASAAGDDLDGKG